VVAGTAPDWGETTAMTFTNRHLDGAFRTAVLLLALALLLLGGARGAWAGMNRFYFASQHDFGAKRGFYLDLENESPDNTLCRLNSLRLIFAVGDGKEWKFLSITPTWETGRTYAVRGSWSNVAGGALFVDGKRAAEELKAGFAAATGPLSYGERPGWASSPAEYAVRPLSLKITVNGKERTVALPMAKPFSLPLYLFEPQARGSLDDLRIPPGAALTVEATFRLEAVPTDLKPLAPFVDAYGQSQYGDWPGKVKADDDLMRAAADETKRYAAWGVAKGYDAYGGYAAGPWKEKATGFYRVTKRDSRWWLISPDGNPTFYTGLCTSPAVDWEKTPVTGREFLFVATPARTGPTGAQLWSRGVWGGDANIDYAAMQSMNLIRKYGTPGWQDKARESLRRRLMAWGFSGQGKWADPVGKTPHVPVLSRSGVPNLAGHPDVFDPAVKTALAAALRRQIEPAKSDAAVLGWSLGNEHDEIITRGEVEEILKKPDPTPAKRALVDHAIEQRYGGNATKLTLAWNLSSSDREVIYKQPLSPPADDLEALRRFYATRYYDFIYKTVKEIDPNHLYLGFWIVPGWWENEEDWRLIAPYCDVIGYDYYSPTFADDRLSRLMRATDKPTLCGEFSFPATYDGARGYGTYDASWVHTDAEAGERYARDIADAAANPYCIGALYFQYRDEPITGRGPGDGSPTLVQGEHYAFGLVDITDRPKWDLVVRVREANLAAVGQRLKPAK
jgi:hypothetical protein